MITHDHGELVAQIGQNARRLVGFLRDPFEIVIGDLPINGAGGLIVKHQPFLHGRDNHAGHRMKVQRADHVRHLALYGAMEIEAGRSRLAVGVAQDVAVMVELEKVRCGDFIP